MAGYSQEFLVDAFISRYTKVSTIEDLLGLEESANKLYTRVGKDRFREYASLDAEAIRKYKNAS